MKLTDLETYRSEIVGKCNLPQPLEITLTAEEREFLITLVSPKIASMQKKIDHARQQNHQTPKAKARLLSDIDKAIMLIKLTNKLKNNE